MNLKGRIAGTIPYDFQPPSFRREIRTWWNPESDAIVVPRAFGIGWALNLAALKRRYPVVFWAAVGLAVVVFLAQWRSGRES
jgi:uncharacterized membrane protein